MPEQGSEKSSLTIFGVIFTVIALTALIALVLVRSRAQESVEQTIGTADVNPTFTVGDQVLTQGGDSVVASYGLDAPSAAATPVVMTAGTMSTPVHLEVPFTATNGVANTILQGEALVRVIAVHSTELGASMSYLWNCKNGPDAGQTIDGTACWKGSWTNGGATEISSVVTANEGDVTGVSGTLSVDITFPFYALPGTWTYMWSIDTNNGTHVSNTGETATIHATHASIVAVNAAPGTLTYAKGAGNDQPLAPLDVSNAEASTVTQKGNVDAYLSAYGPDSVNGSGVSTAWTCSSGQTMPVTITQLIANDPGWTYDTDAGALPGGVANASGIYDWDMDDTLMIGTAAGNQAGVENPGPTTVNFESMIKIPSGISGTCTSLMTILAADAAGAGGGGGGPPKGGGGGVVDNGVSPGISLTTGSTYSDSGAASVAVYGNYAFEGNNFDGTVKILNISDIFNNGTPLVGTASVGAGVPIHGIAISADGNYMYTANYNNNTVSVVNITDKAAPSVVATVAVGGEVTGVAVSGNYVYASDDTNNKIVTIDVSNPGQSAVVGSGISVGTWPQTVKVFGNYAYTPNYSGHSVSIVDISNAPTLTLAGTIDLGPTAGPADVAVVGSHAYIADQPGHVFVYDISNPASATLTTSVLFPNAPTARVPHSITALGNYVYTADLDSDTVTVIDITNPASAYIYGTGYMMNTGDYPIAVAAGTGRVFVANYYYGFEYVNAP